MIRIILRVILALLIIIALALAVPTRLYVRYTGEIFLQVRYLFLKITIPITEEQKAAKAKKNKNNKNTSNKNKTADNGSKKSAKPNGKDAKDDKKEKTKADKKDKKKKKPNPVVKWLKSLYNKGGVDAITGAFKHIASLVGSVLKPIFKTFRIRRLDIDIISASDNAADTAVNYGKLCAGIYPALTVILSVVRYDDYSVNIRPDFDKKELEADIIAEISVIPWAAICGAVCALVRFIGFKIKGEL